MLGTVERVRGGLVNGNRNRFGCWVGLEAGMNGKCFKFHNEFPRKDESR